MKIRVLLLIAILASSALPQKKKEPPPPEIELLAASAIRESGRLLVDARIRSTHQKPLRRLKVVFELLSGDRAVLASKSGPLEPETLQPSDEGELQAQVEDVARATHVRVHVRDVEEKELRQAGESIVPIQ